MGCSNSKQEGVANSVVVYRPPPSSFTVFDITAIEEPWLKFETNQDGDDENNKLSHVPAPWLQKLDMLENEVSNGPRSWDEVSKVLLQDEPKKPTTEPNRVHEPGPEMNLMKKNVLFHTIDELDKPPKPAKNEEDDGKNKRLVELNRVKKTGPVQDQEDWNIKQLVVLNRVKITGPVQDDPDEVKRFPGADPGGHRSVKANPFIMRDRIEREKEGKEAAFDKIMKAKRDPLSDFPELCPPGGSQLVVLYTTSLGGVRRTFEDCNRVRAILEFHRVVFDERDVSLHSGFLTELRELVEVGPGEGVVPRLFVKGRYLGGAEAVVEMNEAGRLGRVLSHARVERGPGWQGCEGCGGARFVPCLECGGSCKVVVVGEDNRRDRCPKCNENGLVHCPRCH